MSSPSEPANSSSPLLAWLRLVRAPNVFTAIADVMMGFVIVHGGLKPLAPLGLLVCLAAASSLLYTAGMVLNDVFDIEVDAKERPFRPLPSGQIPLGLARTMGFSMLACGVVMGALAGYAYPARLPWRSGLIAAVLAGCVLLYDGWLKRFAIGPLGMGLCRFFNVLLGMSVALDVANGWPLGFGPMHLLPAAGIGAYIVGVTMFAKGEAGQSSVPVLIGGMITMGLGIGVLGWAAQFLERRQLSVGVFWLLLALLLFTVLRRCLMAVLTPDSKHVQAGVKNAIFSLVLFDASVAMAAAPVSYSLAIAALLVPMFLLGRWVYST
ncbi:MAG TPA: UbiA family prenyltransferase [Pirellulaceae bacterium]|nr:UbiA family prenyltransferase [Pirellulaceae bacterium]